MRCGIRGAIYNGEMVLQGRIAGVAKRVKAVSITGKTQ